MISISVSSFLEDSKLDLNFFNYSIIIDISKEVFLQNIVFLFNNLLYPLYLYKKNYTVSESVLSTDKLSISPLFMHNNQEAIELHLFLEAWNSLVKVKKEKLTELDPPYNLDNLNEEQLLSIKQVEGPVCLLAGAGSGKTKTLINRILELLNRGVKLKSILVLAFNNKATKEIKERLSGIVIEEDSNIMTFHSFGNKLLHQETTLEFYNEDTREMTKALLEQAVSKYHSVIYKDGIDPMNDYLEMLALVKNNLLSVKDMTMEVNHETIDFFPIFNEYLRLLEEEHFYDYDDMIYLSIHILLKNGHLRRLIQEQYKYILVDEFQDLNKAQLLLLKIISLPQNNLFVVGDDDQMIYAFRGASVDPILNFKREYPYAKEFCLTTNYRSKERIVTYAKRFIDYNLKRVNKDIKANTLERGDVTVKLETSLLKEFTCVLNWLNDLDKGKSIAVIYRYNTYGIFLTSLLEMNGVIKTNIKPQTILKNNPLLKLYLDYLLGSLSAKDLKSLCNVWHIKPSVTNINTLNKYLESKDESLFNRLKKVGKLLATRDLSLKTFMTVLRLTDKELFIPYEGNMTSTELALLLADFIDYFGGIKKFYFYQNTSKNKCLERNITISTIHKTKGNEFDAVCYFHMSSPSKNENLEDERRISYVALTRAKSNILVTSSKQEQLTFIKEYLLNHELSHLNKTELRDNYQLSEEKGVVLSKQLTLLNKDLSLMNNKYKFNEINSFEVAESLVVRDYYESEVRRITSLSNEVLYLEKHINAVKDEIYNRNLF